MERPRARVADMRPLGAPDCPVSLVGFSLFDRSPQPFRRNPPQFGEQFQLIRGWLSVIIELIDPLAGDSRLFCNCLPRRAHLPDPGRQPMVAIGNPFRNRMVWRSGADLFRDGALPFSINHVSCRKDGRE